MKLYKISSLLVTALMFTMATVSCDDDGVIPTPLETSTGSLDKASHNSLSFDWERVAGATQYSCQLSDAKGVVDTKVTNVPSVQFTGLEPSTDYTLTVLAYAVPYSNQTTSEPLELHGRTSDLIVLGTPQLVMDRAGNNLTFTWDVISRAKTYSYTLTKDGEEYESGTTSETSLTFKNLETATYVLSVTAQTDRSGYTDSETAVLSTDFVWENPVAWSVTGTYTSGRLNESWSATLTAYTDGSYTLKNWYNVEGYDLNFSIDTSTPDDMFVLPDDTEYEDGWPKIYTGRSKSPKYVYLYPWDNYCYLSVDEGYLELYLYSNDYYTDTFTWNTGSVDIDITGTWNMTTTGISYLENDDFTAENINWTDQVEVTKVSGNTYRFPALYFYVWDSTMDVTVNWSNKTLTVQPSVYYDYILAGDASNTEAIVGKINDDGTLTFDNWNAWYGSYTYFENVKATFSR